MHFSQVKLYNEKRSDLEEQQLHLNVGLQKIRETVDQVEELQSSLSIKKNELEQKNTLANQKLKQMVRREGNGEERRFGWKCSCSEIDVLNNFVKIFSPESMYFGRICWLYKLFCKGLHIHLVNCSNVIMSSS